MDNDMNHDSRCYNARTEGDLCAECLAEYEAWIDRTDRLGE